MKQSQLHRFFEDFEFGFQLGKVSNQMKAPLKN